MTKNETIFSNAVDRATSSPGEPITIEYPGYISRENYSNILQNKTQSSGLIIFVKTLAGNKIQITAS